MHASAVFQRTESGRNEIKNKMHGLTQSERLALIVIDGVTSYGDLRAKLKGLSEERFERALSKLLHKSLIFEVLLSLDDSVAEELDSKTIDLFLQQDPLDPVTIMSINPEEDFDLDMPAEVITPPQFQAAPLQPNLQVAAPTHDIGEVDAKKVEPAAPIKKSLKITSVDFYIPLEKPGTSLESVTNAPVIKTSSVPSSGRVSAAPTSGVGKPFTTDLPIRKTPWGQLCIILGLVVIVASLVFTYLH